MRKAKSVRVDLDEAQGEREGERERERKREKEREGGREKPLIKHKKLGKLLPFSKTIFVMG